MLFRQKLFGLYPTIPNAIPITELPDYVKEALEVADLMERLRGSR